MGLIPVLVVFPAMIKSCENSVNTVFSIAVGSATFYLELERTSIFRPWPGSGFRFRARVGLGLRNS